MATSIQDLRSALFEQRYLASDGMLYAVHAAMTLQKPLLLEGDPGVGKTTLAQAMSGALGRPLERIQCYEGLTDAHVLYDWHYSKQILAIQQAAEDEKPDVFGWDFVIERALLKVCRANQPSVLLIDEIDKSDDAFEAYVLEFLAELSLTIPELGTIYAQHPPLVIITANQHRPISDALRRRCLFHYVTHLTQDQLTQVLQLHVPNAEPKLTEHVAQILVRIQDLSMQKTTSVGEAVDWLKILLAHNVDQVTHEVLVQSLAILTKHASDQTILRDALDQVI